MKPPPLKLLLIAVLFLAASLAWADNGLYRPMGYQYLSPVPGAEYTSPQTRFVLVRFTNVAPAAITNLAQFIQVVGARSGDHPGQVRIASDNRTVIFQMSTDFQPNEMVTVALTPQAPGGVVQPFQYQFIISGHLPDPGTVTARGDNPPNEIKQNAFDNYPVTKWVDLVVPDGSSNFSWIQYVYPGTDTHVVNAYAITSAGDSPERDPRDWRVYGVDAVGNLTLLESRTNQTFAGRLQKNTYNFTNFTAFRGYRLEITRVANAATAGAVQLAELAFLEPAGTILREYWTGIYGSAVSDLQLNANYPNNPSGRDQLASFEAPVDWADNYGTRVRGYLTAPNTGSFVFWISSDDNSELWLSTNSAPAGMSRIAYVSDWTTSREWNKSATQKSAPVNLVAGQKYYVEALQKEAGGGDNLAVGWAKPGQGTSIPSEVIPGSVLSPWVVGNPADSSSASLSAPANAAPPADSSQQAGASVGTAGGSGGQRWDGTNGPSPLLTQSASPGKAGLMPNGVSVPSDFPFINITVSNNPDPGYIFLDNRGGGGKNYNVIFDNAGSPVWYQKMPDERRDMKVQRNGVLTMLARDGSNHFNGFDTHYQQIATYTAVNGYSTDEHELQVLADGTYFLTALRTETVDMSRYLPGGNPSASVTELVLQEFTAAGDLIFQWRAWDNLNILDQQGFINLTSGGFDFPHMNAIDVDTDGHILLSSRSTSEVTKINRDTGEIIWRLGGPHSDFTLANDLLNGPRNQHSIRMVATNRYIVFDNGNLHNPSESRAVEYMLDLTNHTATLVWQYPPTPTASIYSFYMGNVQRLTNGNTLINWAVGNLPKLTEVRRDGTKAFEMNWVDGYEAYRVWRCPWQGVALRPNLIIESYPDKVLLLFNKFGDTNVAYYRIYGGTNPAPATLLATSPIALANLSSLDNKRQYYFRVSAVDRSGVESALSDEQSVFVDLIKPGENMVSNGDFALGTNSWVWTNAGTASATWKITNGAALVHITSPGTALAGIQLWQAGMKLVQGSSYVLEFDAWSAAPRLIEVRLGQNQSPWTSYKIASPSLTPLVQHFSYPFVMSNATDLNARLMLNFGASAIDVSFDNVYLFKVAAGDFNRDRSVNLNDLSVFASQWLKQAGGLSADLDGDGQVGGNDFQILGANWSGGH